jgi:succinate dehydrogenase / fumarate reductase, cytochrome b subunit
MTVGTLPPRKGPVTSLKSPISTWLSPLLQSTIGAKYIVAITGLMLVGFLIAHLSGNLLVFKGPDALNHYAKMLKDLGPGLWAMRIGLLIAFVVHIYFAIRINLRNQAARPERYQYKATVQASTASTTMVLTGLVILAFVIYHLAHYTFGWTQTRNGVNFLQLKDPLGRHDVYSMVIAGYSNWLVVTIYIIAQVILAFHLSHGISSTFHTLGWTSPKYWPIIRGIALAITIFIVGGNILIPVAVLTGMVR